MRVALYARVSTERQERQGTIASQLDALHRFAQEHGHEVVGAYVCVDDGYSGSRLDRPGLDRLRDGAEAGAFEAVVVLCPDRLARKYAYQVLILEELEHFGVRVIFLEQPPSEDPHVRLLVQIQGAIAEYERMKITERYRRGKLFRARQGEVVSWKVPYGYRRIPRRDGVPAHLEIAEPEAQVVRQIFAWHVEDRLSIRQIALRLTESAHPSATGLRRWAYSMVGRLLRNEAYIGTLYFNRYELLGGDATTAGPRRRTKRRTRRRPVSEWIPISVPPLISEELFRRSQAIHPDNSRFSPRHLKSGHYLLRGLVRCRVCDLGTSCHRMRGRDGTFHHYYYCTGHDLLRARSREGCPQRNLRADELDALVWTEVRRHLEDPILILEAYAKLRAEPVLRPDDVVAQESRALEHKLVEMDREEHRLLDAYQAGLIELPQLERRQGVLRQRRSHVQGGLEMIRSEHTAALRRADLQISLQSFTRSVRAPLATLPFEDRQRLVRAVIERVMVEEGQVDIHFAIPVPEPPNGDGPDRRGQVSGDFHLRPHHAGIEPVMQGRLREQGQRVRLLLGQGRGVAGGVSRRGGRAFIPAPLVQRLAGPCQCPQEERAHFRRQPPAEHHGAVLVLVDVKRPARVLPRGLAGLRLPVHLAPATHDPLDLGGHAGPRHAQQALFGLRGGDARQGPELGVREFPAREGLGQERQCPQGARHPDPFPGRPRVESHPPAQPGGAGAEPGVPAPARVELADQVQEARGGGLELRR